MSWQNYTPHTDFNQKTPSNYWKNLTAPYSPEAREARYLLTWVFGSIIIIILLYKFQTDVDYELQYQITWISKKYHILNSNGVCVILIFVAIGGFAFKRWWYWFINNLWTTALLFAKVKMENVDVYKNAFTNGIFVIREYFNYSCNFYLYKALTPEQVAEVLQLEFNSRYSLISYTLYKDCRYGIIEDPWIDEFFNSFRLDWVDAKSYERIINQIDIFQINKIDQGRLLMDIADLEYIRDHPFKYYGGNALDSLGYFFSEYTGHLILGSFFGLIIISIAYYNLVEDPNIRENLSILWKRWVDNGFNPTLNPRGKFIEDIFSIKLHNIFGQVEPEKYLSYLHILSKQNASLLHEFSKNTFVDASVIQTLGPELAKKAYDTLLPQNITQMVPQMLETQNLCVELSEKILKNMNNSPFEQFEVIILQKISFLGIDLSITNMTLFLGISLSVIAFFSVVIYTSLSLIPKYWQSVIEIFYSFIFSMLIDQAGKKAKVYFPAIFSVFFFILVNNLLGLIPLSFAVTSHVVVTFCLGFGFFVAWVIVAFRTIGLKVFQMFWPTNVPLWLRPLLMVVEILSFSLRPFSLSIRLFVNMLAGHVLLHLVGGSVVLVFSKAAIFSFIPFILLLAVFCLELGIAFLQAYIFSILLCIYLHDSYHAH